MFGVLLQVLTDHFPTIMAIFEQTTKPTVPSPTPTTQFFAPRAPSFKGETPGRSKLSRDLDYFLSSQSLLDISKKIQVCKRTKLSQTKITPSSRVDTQTAVVLDEVMGRATLCGSLKQYIELKGKPISDGNFLVHKHSLYNDYLRTPGDAGSSGSKFDSDDWHRAVNQYLTSAESGFKSMPLGDRRERIKEVGGFYDRTNDKVNMPSDGTFGNALHEAVHRLSKPLLKNLYGSELNEGVTQYFTDMILRDEGLPPVSGHKYGDNLTLAKHLVRKIGGFDLLAKLYFSGSVEVHKKILVLLGIYKTENDPIRRVGWSEILRAIRK